MQRWTDYTFQLSYFWFLAFENETDRLSRKYHKELPLIAL